VASVIGSAGSERALIPNLNGRFPESRMAQKVTSGRSAAAYSNGFSTRTSKREKSRTLRVTTVRSCTSAVAAIMASS